MKKLLLILLISLFSVQLFGCAGGGDAEVNPEYSTVYSLNDNYHWRAQTNGDGRTDYAEHENDNGKCVCGKYFDASEALTYSVITIDGVKGLEVSAYDKNSSIVHVEIPAFHDFNGETLPVLQIAQNCFSASSLRSIKLNEGLIYVNKGSFTSTFIEEFIFPDSVKGQSPSIYPGHGGLDTVFYDCVSLKRVVLGDGIKILGGYVFANCKNLSEVVFGNNIEQIWVRAFYECKSLNEVVLPKSVKYIQEGSIYTPAVGRDLSLNRMFTYANTIYLDITKEELRDLTVPLFTRDQVTGKIIDDGIVRNPGYCEGWAGMADILYKGEWTYDKNGKPVEI